MLCFVSGWAELLDDPVALVALDDGLHVRARVRGLREDEETAVVRAHCSELVGGELDEQRAARLLAFADVLLVGFGGSGDDGEIMQTLVDLPE